MTGEKAAAVHTSVSVQPGLVTVLKLRLERRFVHQSGEVEQSAWLTLNTVVLVESRKLSITVVSSQLAFLRITLNIMDLDPDVLTMPLQQVQRLSATK